MSLLIKDITSYETEFEIYLNKLHNASELSGPHKNINYTHLSMDEEYLNIIDEYINEQLSTTASSDFEEKILPICPGESKHLINTDYFDLQYNNYSSSDSESNNLNYQELKVFEKDTSCCAESKHTNTDNFDLEYNNYSSSNSNFEYSELKVFETKTSMNDTVESVDQIKDSINRSSKIISTYNLRKKCPPLMSERGLELRNKTINFNLMIRHKILSKAKMRPKSTVSKAVNKFKMRPKSTVSKAVNEFKMRPEAVNEFKMRPKPTVSNAVNEFEMRTEAVNEFKMKPKSTVSKAVNKFKMRPEAVNEFKMRPEAVNEFKMRPKAVNEFKMRPKSTVSKLMLYRSQIKPINPYCYWFESLYYCDLCCYSSKVRSMILLHSRRHMGEKPYKCNLCPYASVEKSHLARHQMTHSGKRPHKCKHCSYSCIQKSSLKMHVCKGIKIE